MTEKECAIIYQTANVKTLTPIIDADVEQVRKSIAVLEGQLVDLYSHHMKLFEIEATPYRERIAEQRKALAVLQPPGCFGQFAMQPVINGVMRCDTCESGARCDKAEQTMSEFRRTDGWPADESEV